MCVKLQFSPGTQFQLLALPATNQNRVKHDVRFLQSVQAAGGVRVCVFLCQVMETSFGHARLTHQSSALRSSQERKPGQRLTEHFHFKPLSSLSSDVYFTMFLEDFIFGFIGFFCDVVTYTT